MVLYRPIFIEDISAIYFIFLNMFYISISIYDQVSHDDGKSPEYRKKPIVLSYYWIFSKVAYR